MNNIFTYAPKELTTDAFLNWVFVELNREDLRDQASIFFYKMGLCEKAGQRISQIVIRRQEKNTDLTVRYCIDDVEHAALFENKTTSSMRDNQLEDYKEKFLEFNYFKYLKLSWICYSERCIAERCGYETITAKNLYDALDALSFPAFLLHEYKSFLWHQYVDPIEKLERSLISENKYESLEDARAQQMVLSDLHEELDKSNSYNLEFKAFHNQGGTPYVQLDIANRVNAYGAVDEYLFWRIDKRSSKYYLRLNQYADIDSQQWEEKNCNLERLREKVNGLVGEHELVLGQPSNRGKKESEVIIFFFEDNDLKLLTKTLPVLSREIIKAYLGMFKNH
jgi:hypothetical protein